MCRIKYTYQCPYFHCHDRKTSQGLQKPLQSSANAKEEGVQDAKNPLTLPLTSDESVLGGHRCSSMLSNIKFYVKEAFMLVACVMSKIDIFCFTCHTAGISEDQRQEAEGQR